MIDMDNILKIQDWRIRKALTEIAEQLKKPKAPAKPKFSRVEPSTKKPSAKKVK